MVSVFDSDEAGGPPGRRTMTATPRGSPKLVGPRPAPQLPPAWVGLEVMWLGYPGMHRSS